MSYIQINNSVWKQVLEALKKGICLVSVSSDKIYMLEIRFAVTYIN